MTSGEFIEATDELEKYYKKELTVEERRIWFEELKNINVIRYKAILKEIFRQKTFMPKLADIININKTLYIETKQEEIKTVECDICGRKRNSYI